LLFANLRNNMFCHKQFAAGPRVRYNETSE
jgi:hypothetical protein